MKISIASLLVALTALPSMTMARTSNDGEPNKSGATRRALRASRHGGTHNQVVDEVVHDNKESVQRDEEDTLLETFLEDNHILDDEDEDSLYDKAFLEADTYEHILQVDIDHMTEGDHDAAGDYYDDEEGNGVRRRMTSSSPRLFYLRNKGTGKYLDVAGAKCHNGNNIHLWEFNGSNAQRFYWHAAPNGKTYLINAGCHKAVDISKSNCDNGNNIHLWGYHGLFNQEFKRYQNLIYNPKCMTAIDNSSQGSRNGNNIQSHRINFTLAQEWEISYV